MMKVLPKKYIAVHIRRGDYVKFIHHFPLLREFKRCEYAYFKAGIAHIRNIRPDLRDAEILICTDSPDKVDLQEFADDASVVSFAPVAPDVKPKFADFITLYLASAVVISNSTYSW